jgi:RHS repeat-associated protein
VPVPTRAHKSRAAISGRRYYNPSQGRFFGRDPIGEKGGIHLYAFCRNNAINGYDFMEKIFIAWK